MEYAKKQKKYFSSRKESAGEEESMKRNRLVRKKNWKEYLCKQEGGTAWLASRIMQPVECGWIRLSESVDWGTEKIN